MSKEAEQEFSETPTAVLEPTQELVRSRVNPSIPKKVAAVRPAAVRPAAVRPAAIDPPVSVPPVRKKRSTAASVPPRRFPATYRDDDSSNRQAELFYLQKQIQQQTPMVFILEDGERIQGIVEWYDRHSIKVRGKSRVLIYKTAIKYLYKAGEIGSAPEK